MARTRRRIPVASEFARYIWKAAGSAQYGRRSLSRISGYSALLAPQSTFTSLFSWQLFSRKGKSVGLGRLCTCEKGVSCSLRPNIGVNSNGPCNSAFTSPQTCQFRIGNWDGPKNGFQQGSRQNLKAEKRFSTGRRAQDLDSENGCSQSDASPLPYSANWAL